MFLLFIYDYLCVSVSFVVVTFMSLVALTCLKSLAYLIVSIVCLFVCFFLLGTNVIYKFDHLWVSCKSHILYRTRFVGVVDVYHLM